LSTTVVEIEDGYTATPYIWYRQQIRRERRFLNPDFPSLILLLARRANDQLFWIVLEYPPSLASKATTHVCLVD
jgi:hypothetical protein